MNLSINIPSSSVCEYPSDYPSDYPEYEEKKEKKEKKQENNSNIWASVIYEVWDEENIYKDLKERMKQLYEDFKVYKMIKDFSYCTRSKLEEEKKMIEFGIGCLFHRNYSKTSLLEYNMKNISKMKEKYDYSFKKSEYKKEKKGIKKMTIDLIDRLRSFRMDINDSINTFDDFIISYISCGKMVNIKEFYMEEEQFNREINYLEKSRLVSSEKMELIYDLMDEIRLDLSEYEIFTNIQNTL